MANWEVIINGLVFKPKATNAWTATTRAIKLYWQKKGTLGALNCMDIYVRKLEPQKKGAF